MPANQPLFWYGYCLAKFLEYDLGPFREGRREVRNCASWPTPTWLSNKRTDPNELVNLADAEPQKLREMQEHLLDTFLTLDAPPEQIDRLGLR